MTNVPCFRLFSNWIRIITHLTPTFEPYRYFWLKSFFEYDKHITIYRHILVLNQLTLCLSLLLILLLNTRVRPTTIDLKRSLYAFQLLHFRIMIIIFCFRKFRMHILLWTCCPRTFKCYWTAINLNQMQFTAFKQMYLMLMVKIWIGRCWSLYS